MPTGVPGVATPTGRSTLRLARQHGRHKNLCRDLFKNINDGFQRLYNHGPYGALGGLAPMQYLANIRLKAPRCFKGDEHEQEFVGQVRHNYHDRAARRP
jgi:hypothetical protein